MTPDFPDQSSIDSLADTIAGRVLLPGDEGYETAIEIWNARLQEYPAIVTQCQLPEDVRAGMNFATEHDLELAVKGGGHDYAGQATCEDGLLLDLSSMTDIEVDPDANVATVEAGATWGELDEATQEHGLVVPGPTVSSVGIAGATLGGGQGHLSRKFGFSLDNVRSFEVVTTDGEIIMASEDDHPDLFWALRGGSGNFGVVTEFEFDLHEAGPTILGGQAMHPIDDAEEVLRFYREYMEDLPVDAICWPFIIPIPPLEAFPEEMHGQPAITLVAAYDGDEERGEGLIQPLREFGDPLFADFSWMPYTDLQAMFDDGVPDGLRWYSKSYDIDELTDEVISTFVEYGQDLHGPFSMTYFGPMDGAMSEPAVSDTAFAGRDGQYNFHVLCGWEDQDRDSEMIEWTDEFATAMSEHARESVYVNLLNETEADRVPAAYGSNYQRLRELKRSWDPADKLVNTYHIDLD